MMKRQQGDILPTTLDLTDKSAIRIHAHRNRFLAQIGRKTIAANIDPYEFADIHPQLRNRSRILMRRIIILGELIQTGVIACVLLLSYAFLATGSTCRGIA
jgi:hypothetical protein